MLPIAVTLLKLLLGENQLTKNIFSNTMEKYKKSEKLLWNVN